MKKFAALVITFAIVLPDTIQAELCFLDEINFVVCGPEKNEPFTNTDLTWKSKPLQQEKEFMSASQQIQNEIVAQQVSSEKMPIEPDAIAKYIEGIKKQLHVNDAELAEIFGDSGRTMEEGIKWFSNQYVVEFFTHYKFKTQLVPTEDDILNYFNENPEFIDGFYEIQIARVPYTSSNREDVKNDIEQFLLHQDQKSTQIFWEFPIKIDVDALHADQMFIKDMKPEEVRIVELQGLFELTKLVAYQPTMIKSLKDRESAIIETLNRKKLATMLKNYNDRVREEVDVIMFKEIH